MTAAHKATIEALYRSKASLDAEDTAISEVIKEIAAEMPVRMRVEVPFDDAAPGAFLAFGKHGGTWQFIVEYQGDHATPLLSAPRDLRAMSFTAIEALINDAANQVDVAIVERKVALTEGRALLDALKEKK